MLGSNKSAGGGDSAQGIVDWMLNLHPLVKATCVMAIVLSGLILVRLALFDDQIAGDTTARTERARAELDQDNLDKADRRAEREERAERKARKDKNRRRGRRRGSRDENAETDPDRDEYNEDDDGRDDGGSDPDDKEYNRSDD